MGEEKMLTKDEARGIFNVVKEFLLLGNGELSNNQRKGIGRLLSEIQYTNDSDGKQEKPELYPVR